MTRATLPFTSKRLASSRSALLDSILFVAVVVVLVEREHGDWCSKECGLKVRVRIGL